MKKIFYLMMLAIVTLAAGSCSKDDEPSDYTPTYDGVSIYLNAIEKLYNNEGMPMYVATETPGVYMVIADNEGIADWFISDLLEKTWNGKDVTVKLGENGESGNLQIFSSNLPAGVYDKIVVDILGDMENYPPYTLLIVTEAYFNNENSAGISGGGVARLEGPNS